MNHQEQIPIEKDISEKPSMTNRNASKLIQTPIRNKTGITIKKHQQTAKLCQTSKIWSIYLISWSRIYRAPTMSCFRFLQPFSSQWWHVFHREKARLHKKVCLCVCACYKQNPLTLNIWCVYMSMQVNVHTVSLGVCDVILVAYRILRTTLSFHARSWMSLAQAVAEKTCPLRLHTVPKCNTTKSSSPQSPNALVNWGSRLNIPRLEISNLGADTKWNSKPLLGYNTQTQLAGKWIIFEMHFHVEKWWIRFPYLHCCVCLLERWFLMSSPFFWKSL